MTAAEVLEKAAEYIERHGWYQGGVNGPGASTCAAGAVNYLTWGSRDGSTYNEGQDTVRCEAFDYLRARLPELDIASWNDAPERTREEVCQKLREVAASLTDQPKVPDPAIEQIEEAYA